MSEKIKSLKEVSEEIGEVIGKKKSINTSDGYYVHNTRTRKEFELIDGKIVTELSFKGRNQPISYGYFKSKRGYNSKYKNTKEYANHYGEYLAYIILKQLGKKACKVDIGTRDIRHPFSNKTLTIDGILSHHQLSMVEIFRAFSVSLEKYRGAHPKKYKEATPRGGTNSEKNNTNVELILSALEYELESNGQKEDIPEMRQHFFNMCIFDLKFANRDRHDENWAMKVNNSDISLYPLYDNERVLGLYENQNVIEEALRTNTVEETSEKVLFSRMRVPEDRSKPCTYKAVLNYLMQHYNEETSKALEKMLSTNTPDKVHSVLEECEGLPKCYIDFGTKMHESRYNFAKELYQNRKKITPINNYRFSKHRNLGSYPPSSAEEAR